MEKLCEKCDKTTPHYIHRDGLICQKCGWVNMICETLEFNVNEIMKENKK